MQASRAAVRTASLLAAFVLVAGACGGGGDDGESGDGDLVSTDGLVLDQDVEIAAPPENDGAGAGGAAETDDESDAGGDDDEAADGDASTTTIPLNEDEDVAGTMFEALRIFNECLEDLGTPFLGDPRGAEEGSPLTDPTYTENLRTCAARSNIVEAMETMQQANEEMTPDQIEERNRGMVRWAGCMEGRGWTIDLQPDDRGLLNPTTFEGPDGEMDLDSDDMQECAEQSQAEDGDDG